MELKLRVVAGVCAGQIVKIPGPNFMIGREKDCHLRPTSNLVEGHHCALIVDGVQVTIRDFETRHGTLVNGKRVRGQRELNLGDYLQIGPLKFEILIDRISQSTQPSRLQSSQKAAPKTASEAA